jgi:hypothetical protein
MTNDWIRDIIDGNKKYKRETILNYVVNRWGLNKSSSVSKIAELIRECSPKTIDDWRNYYFNNAKQNKKNGIKISEKYIENLGKIAYKNLNEIVKPEIEKINENEFIDYIFNLVIDRTYNGYITEINVIFSKLQEMVSQKIENAPDEWDRKYNVDYYIKINDKYIGLQVKPIASGKSINDYQWEKMHLEGHNKFTQNFGGAVFFVYSKEIKKKKEIYNIEIVDEIKKEIQRLSQ